MHKGKSFEKENQCPIGNFYTHKEKSNHSQMHFMQTKTSVQNYRSQATLQKKTSFNINELENLNLIETYGREYLNKNKCIPHCAFLSKHNVTCLFRAKMVDWMTEVMASYKCSDRSLFKAIEIMDMYYQKSFKYSFNLFRN